MEGTIYQVESRAELNSRVQSAWLVVEIQERDAIATTIAPHDHHLHHIITTIFTITVMCV